MEDRIIAVVLWILYTIPGNALMFGIVQFDRLGGDPLKRRITDQVTFQMICPFETIQLLKGFTYVILFNLQIFSNALLLLIFNNCYETVQVIQIIFDLNYPNYVTNFNGFLQIQTNLFSILTILEILTFKYWMRFIKKSVVAMNDQIIVFYLMLQNLFISSLFAITKVIIGDGEFWSRSLQTSKNIKLNNAA